MERMSDMPQFTQTIVGCARCYGEGHADLTFKMFRHPPEPWTHWATCPVTGEPILFSETQA